MTFQNEKNFNVLFLTAIWVLLLSLFCLAQNNPVSSDFVCQNSRIMDFKRAVIFAPHPDDEVLGFGGVIYEAIHSVKEIKVIIVTDGAAYIDACYLWKNGCPMGSCEGVPCDNNDFDLFSEIRRKESVKALALLGVDKSMIGMLGYPDGRLKTMYDFPGKKIPANGTKESANNGKSISGKNLLEDIKSILRQYKDATIFTTHPDDHHGDHSTLALFIQKARKQLREENLNFTTYWTLIHEPHTGDDNTWPFPVCDWTHDNYQIKREMRYNPQWILRPPAGFENDALYFCMDSLLWKPSIYKEPLMRTTIDTYRTQLGSVLKNGDDMNDQYKNWTDFNGYLISFVKQNHLYWKASSP